MKQVMIDKVTLNIGVGEAGEKVNKALAILENISGQKAIKTTSKKRIPTWNVRPGMDLAAKVTLRGKRAEELLARLFEAVDKNVKKRSFDSYGNLSFGIRSYIDIPGTKYEPSIGIFGMDVAVTLKRHGYRVKLRKKLPSTVGKSHLLNRDDAISFLKEKFGVNVK